MPTGRQKYCLRECYDASLRVPIQQRFWSKVNKNGPVPSHVAHLGPCWLWAGSTVRGYGQIAYAVDGKRRPVPSHRVAWELANGPVPTGMSVLHKCDTPLCQRPDHLFLGTQQENLDDARQKGRLIDGRGARKLSDDAYREILSSTKRGHGVEMMRKYGVSEVTISRIKHGKQGLTFHQSESQRRRSA